MRIGGSSDWRPGGQADLRTSGRAARRRTLILSDVHLATLEPSGLRAGKVPPDIALAAAVERAVWESQMEGAALEIVLAGDVFDLDAPPTSEDEPNMRARRGEIGATYLTGRILEHHAIFVGALRSAIARGARVVILPGNHDAQIALPAVRAVISRHLLSGLFPDLRMSGLANRLIFRAWLHVTPDGILIEHGHRYDPLCVVPMLPEHDLGGELSVPASVGTVATYRGTVLGSVDPHAVDPLAGRRRSELLADGLANAGPTGLLEALRDILTATSSLTDQRTDGSDWSSADLRTCGQTDMLARLAALETGLRPDALRAHAALAVPAASGELLAELACGRYDYGADVAARLRSAMRGAGALHRVRAVVVGHTHEPSFEIEGGVAYANCGSWTTDEPTYVQIVSEGKAIAGKIELGRYTS